jgi:hypothetical protein
VSNPDCVLFFGTEVARIVDILVRVESEAKEVAVSMWHRNWTGWTLYFSVMHCIPDCDETWNAFIYQHNTMDQTELDVQNAPVQPLTGYKILANKWNNPTFNPTT